MTEEVCFASLREILFVSIPSSFLRFLCLFAAITASVLTFAALREIFIRPLFASIGGHPFTAPESSPAIKYFCTNT